MNGNGSGNGDGPRLGRRSLMAIGVMGVTAPLVAAGSGAPLHRRAKFIEVGDSIIMELSLPELLSTRDRDAMESLSSGFATRLVYDVSLYKQGPGQSKPVRHTTREVRIHYDLWNEKYVVETVDAAGSPGRVHFRLRDPAVQEVGVLRIRVGRASEMERGPRNTYYAAVFAQRNPVRSNASGGKSGAGHGQSSDLQMFRRWVSIFVRTRLKAEKTMLVRTSQFYLVES